MRCVIVVHPNPLAQEDTDLLAESPQLSCAKICVDVSRFSPEVVQGQAQEVDQEREERNIQQRRIHRRNESSHVEFLDQHHHTRPNDYVHGYSSD